MGNSSCTCKETAEENREQNLDSRLALPAHDFTISVCPSAASIVRPSSSATASRVEVPAPSYVNENQKKHSASGLQSRRDDDSAANSNRGLDKRAGRAKGDQPLEETPQQRKERMAEEVDEKHRKNGGRSQSPVKRMEFFSEEVNIVVPGTVGKPSPQLSVCNEETGKGVESEVGRARLACDVSQMEKGGKRRNAAGTETDAEALRCLEEGAKGKGEIGSPDSQLQVQPETMQVEIVPLDSIILPPTFS